MPSAPSNAKKKRYKVWLKQADYDLRAAKLSYGNKFYEWACFQSEQSAEKALKSVLVHAGWRPPKMHKLSILVSYCNHANEEFNRTRVNFRDLESFTFISRYPFLIPGNDKAPHKFIQKRDAESCLSQAEGMFVAIQKILEGEQVDYKEKGEIIAKSPDKLLIRERLNIAINKLVNEFDPEKILLFGSYARGDYKPGSTIDLMIIADTNLRFLDRIKRAVNLLSNGHPPIEPLVYTNQEFEHVSTSEGFFETALGESTILYEKGKKREWTVQ